MAAVRMGKVIGMRITCPACNMAYLCHKYYLKSLFRYAKIRSVKM